MPAPERPAPTLPSGSSAARPISPPSVPVGAALPSSPISIDPTLSVTLPVPSDQPQLVHIVVSGDTLFNIARRYSVSVADLKTENSLTTDSIALGQRLRIPGRIDPALGAGPRGLRDIAERYLGVTYVYGGSSAQGLDCSGFVSIVFAEIGVRLPRTSREQFQTGSAVAQPDLELGDLVFFDTLGAGAVSHVGIYLGGGEFIHAASNPGKVIKSKLEEKYYAVRYLGARRVLAQD
jgi:cell wall-associated NlpC family hydrolase